MVCAAFWYFPLAQVVHAPVPASPDDPALHLQLPIAMLPAGEVDSSVHAVQAPSAEEAVAMLYLPTPQSVHGAEPAASLYFPAAHPRHVPPLSPVKPALQVQLPPTPLPAGEFACSGQDVHSRSPGAENLPASHVRQF